MIFIVTNTSRVQLDDMYMDNKNIYLQSQETNVTESDEAVAEDVEINPPLGDSNADNYEIDRALETAALFSQEKHCEHCKLCDMMIEGNFEDHLHNSHFKQELESVIPKKNRSSSEFGCSGKKIYLFSVF